MIVGVSFFPKMAISENLVVWNLTCPIFPKATTDFSLSSSGWFRQNSIKCLNPTEQNPSFSSKASLGVKKQSNSSITQIDSVAV